MRNIVDILICKSVSSKINIHNIINKTLVCNRKLNYKILINSFNNIYFNIKSNNTYTTSNHLQNQYV